MHSTRSNWDHIRYVLAVAEAGSVSKAARKLGVNHATVLRHVAAFEEENGASVFNKSVNGYSVLRDKIRVIDAARDVETAVLAVQRIIAGVQAPVRGLVRVTSTDSFCQVVLPPIVGKWHDQLSELRIALLSTNSHLDLSRLDADIIVRPTSELGEDLDGVIAAKLGFGLYRARASNVQTWLALGGRLQNTGAASWMSENVAGDLIAGSADSFLTLRDLAAEGLGQAILPCIIADGDTRLERRPNIIPKLAVNIWVASHVELVNVPRIKAVKNMLVEALAANAVNLLGLDHQVGAS